MRADAEFSCPFPLSNRQSKLYGFGVNRFNVNGSLMVVVKSIEKMEGYEENKEKETRESQNKKLVEMYLHCYGYEIFAVSPT